jgi:flagellar FliL protein
LISGGGYVGWKYFFNKEDIATENTNGGQPHNKVDIKIVHEMKPFIVNLLGNQGKRYLKTKIDLEIGGEEILNEIIERDSEIRDGILLLLASKTFDDISKPEGKISLRGELITQINTLLKKEAVRALYFTEFVVQ